MSKKIFKIDITKLIASVCNFESQEKYEQYFELRGHLMKISSLQDYIESLPVYPAWRDEILRMDFIRAIHGTLAIEDSGITFQEVEKVISGEISEEQSSNKREKEASNALKVYEFVQEWVQNNPDGKITESVISQLNTIITRDLGSLPDRPGLYRNHAVSFGLPRRGAGLTTLSEIQTAMAKLVEFINGTSKPQVTALSHTPTTTALTAHYLITLIHPFSDGNGRVARALEALILHRYGGFAPYCFPITAKFYYENREKYFELLRLTDDTGGIFPFLFFSIDGLVTKLQDIKEAMLEKITHALITDYIHDLRRKKSILKRQVSLMEVLLSSGDMDYNEFWSSPVIRALYTNLSESTRRRDIINLSAYNLITLSGKKTVEGKKQTTISANWDVLKGLPMRLKRNSYKL